MCSIDIAHAFALLKTLKQIIIPSFVDQNISKAVLFPNRSLKFDLISSPHHLSFVNLSANYPEVVYVCAISYTLFHLNHLMY